MSGSTTGSDLPVISGWSCHVPNCFAESGGLACMKQMEMQALSSPLPSRLQARGVLGVAKGVW
jgi:hypothetical protein